MPTLTVKIEKELYEKMRKIKWVNWSELIREFIRRKTIELKSYFTPGELRSLVDIDKKIDEEEYKKVLEREKERLEKRKEEMKVLHN